MACLSWFFSLIGGTRLIRLSLGDRLTVGLQPLELRIGVRIPVPQLFHELPKPENFAKIDIYLMGS